MRITNVSNTPRYFAYSGSAGKTLNPGETSPKLPLDTIHRGILWKDIQAGFVRLNLSPADKDFLNKVLREDGKTAERKPQAAKPAMREQRRQAALAAQAAHAERVAAIAARNAKLRGVRMNPGGATGQPSFGKTEPAAPIPVVVPGKAVSLEQLKQHNKGVVKKAVAKPKSELPVVDLPEPAPPSNRPNIALGQPIFSPGPGPGTENRGAGKPLEETLQRMKGGGSMV